MSDKYIALNTFKYGLDTRRDVLTTVLGALVQLQNARVNAGGELEQRKSFVKDSNAFPANTLGLQDTDAGLVTFGSDASPSGSLPTGVTYQRLVPPTNAGGNLSAVLSSCNFQGKAFAVVQFDNSSGTFFYYNAALVLQAWAGFVEPKPGGGGIPEDVTDLAKDLAALINNVPGWTADTNVVVGPLGVEIAYSGGVVIKSPPGIHFTPITGVVTSATGTLSASLFDQNNGGTPGTAAVAAFQITAGTTGTITVVAGTTSIVPSPVPPNAAGNNATAADVALAVNLMTSSTGFSASVVANTVTVFAPVSLGNYTAQLILTWTGDITIVAGSSGTQSKLQLTPANLDVIKVVAGSVRATTVFGVIQASVPGSIHVPTYTWAETDAQGNAIVGGVSPTGIQMSSTTGTSVAFSKSLNVPSAVQGFFKCTSNDGGALSTVHFTVTLEADNNL